MICSALRLAPARKAPSITPAKAPLASVISAKSPLVQPHTPLKAPAARKGSTARATTENVTAAAAAALADKAKVSRQKKVAVAWGTSATATAAPAGTVELLLNPKQKVSKRQSVLPVDLAPVRAAPVASQNSVVRTRAKAPAVNEEKLVLADTAADFRAALVAKYKLVSVTPTGSLATLSRNSWIVTDPALAAAVVAKMPKNLKGKTVIEALPGPGVLTQELLTLPLRRLIGLEPSARFNIPLKALERAHPGVFEHVAGDLLKLDLDEGCPPTHALLHDVTPVPWSSQSECPVALVGCAPVAKHGTTFLLSWFYKMGSCAGPFHWGRVPAVLLIPRYFTDTLLAEAGSKHFQRLSVLSQTLCTVNILASFKRDRFDPIIYRDFPELNMDLIHIVPKAVNPLIDGNVLGLDYILRRMMTMRSKSLLDVCSMLGPGGHVLLERAGIAPGTAVKGLSVSDYVRLSNAFATWKDRPFIATLGDAGPASLYSDDGV